MINSKYDSYIIYFSNPKSINLSDIEFSENLSLNEFKVNLEKYANNSPYPSIDN